MSQTHLIVESDPEFMTVKEAAEYLRIPVATAYYLVQRGHLPGIQIGGRWWIKRGLLDRDVLRKDGDASQPSVLVVDDDEALQALFELFLKRTNLARLIVGSGAEALSIARERRFNLVFLDLNLPDIPGDEVYLRLKSLHPDLRIVIITGYPDSEMLSKILSIGPVTVMKKPLDFELLNKAVRQLRSCLR